MTRERYFMQSAAIERASYLMSIGRRVNYYPDMDDGQRCYIVEFSS